jgi:hypothetical protein
LCFKFTLEYAIRKVQGNQEGHQLNGTRQLLLYADDANLMGENINTAKKHVGLLLYFCRRFVQLSRFREKISKPICSSLQHITGLNENMKVADISFESMRMIQFLAEK